MEPEADPVEALMARWFESGIDPASADIEALATAHPEHADAVRSRLRFLKGVQGERAPASSSRPLAAIGFQVGARIGGGGMGVVHRGRELSTGREVAIKWLRPEQAWSTSARLRFQREVDAIAGLSHPGIVSILTAGETGDTPWFAMELVDGSSVAALLGSHHGKNPAALRGEDLHQPGSKNHVEAAVAICIEVAEALVHAHERGVVHRDLKPSNVMIERSGRARVIDFGLAMLSSADTLTRTGAQPGSLAYMSPEQVRGEVLDPRTDVWSLGVVLFELLTLLSPFQRLSEAATRQAILEASPPHARRHHPQVGRDLAAVIATAMAPERHRRYATMSAFADDLRAASAHAPVHARPAGPWLRLCRFARRRPARVLGLTALALLVALPSALWWQQRAANTAVRQQVARAEVAEKKSKDDADAAWQMVGFLESLFADATPEYSQGREPTMWDALARGIASIQARTNVAPDLRSRLLEAMARSCFNSGWYSEATELTRQVDELTATLPPLDPSEGSRRQLLRARLAAARGQPAVRERWLRSLLATPESDPVAVAEAKVELGDLLVRQAEKPKAKQLLTAGIEELRQHLPASDPRVAAAAVTHARWVLHASDADAAVAAIEAALSALDSASIADPRRFRALLQAIEHCELNDYAERADALVAEAIAAADAAGISSRHPLRGLLRIHVAEQALRRDRPREALAEAEAAIAALRQASIGSDEAIARALLVAARAAVIIGEVSAALGFSAEAVQNARNLTDPDPDLMVQLLMNRARQLEFVGQHVDAAALLEEALASASSANGLRGSVRARLCRTQAKAGLVEAARRNAALVMAELANASSGRRCDGMANLAFAHLHLSDLITGKRIAEQAVAIVGARGSTARAWPLQVLGMIQLRLQDFAAALANFDQSLAINRQRGPNQPVQWVDTLHLFGVALMGAGREQEALRVFDEVLTVLAPMEAIGELPKWDAHENRLLLLVRMQRPAAATSDLTALLPQLGHLGWPTERVANLLGAMLEVADHPATAAARAAMLEALTATTGRLLPPDHPLQARIRATR
jgi:eukaryotic-like serine/threonine-protein kinase